MIRAYYVLPPFIWSRYFIEAQGLDAKDAVMYQDNLSAMLLYNNGILSSVNRMKRICVIYFLITDRIAMEDLEIE